MGLEGSTFSIYDSTDYSSSRFRDKVSIVEVPFRKFTEFGLVYIIRAEFKLKV